MSKSGQSILRGARQALEYARGARGGFVAHVPEDVDVATIRKRLGLSQTEFAARFGFKLDAVQNWEQGRRPEGAARAFLRVIEREPAAVQRALAGQPGRRGRHHRKGARFIVITMRDVRFNWCGRPDSNRHRPHGPRDFRTCYGFRRPRRAP
ncbi:helix-turn-helix domain-containing protein [Xanthobacteraceae bacterium Astr-EGSB]|uniref:helix-turn-helix domain-containing protein n=1 Tax=Astrobacterium formosum TaxID=3069710 RepID=UPI0027B34D72|nr:helix-turn-helix domain-containing protein [Xanthobacteraceae bacterium Astr-EGSB]